MSLPDPTDAQLALLTEHCQALQEQASRVHEAYSYPSMDREEAIRRLLLMIEDLPL